MEGETKPLVRGRGSRVAVEGREYYGLDAEIQAKVYFFSFSSQPVPTCNNIGVSKNNSWTTSMEKKKRDRHLSG